MNKTETTVVKREYATYTVNTTLNTAGDVIDHDIEIEFTGKDRLPSRNWFSLPGDDNFPAFIEKNEKKLAIITIMNEFVVEMEGYAYYGSNPGIPQDEFEEVADALMKKFAF